MVTTAPESSGQSALGASTRKLLAGIGLFVAVCVVAVAGSGGSDAGRIRQDRSR